MGGDFRPCFSIDPAIADRHGRLSVLDPESNCVTKLQLMLVTGLAFAVLGGSGAAAPKRPAPRATVKPVTIIEPALVAAVAEERRPGSFMVPREIVLKNPTLAEREANAVWNIRAALNVAALQCQFSGFLKTTKNYNSFLQAHSEELARAQKTMIGHFRRTDGAKADNSFDMYTTRTYNSFSTLDAQYAFCNAAGFIGRRVLAVPKNKLGEAALANGPAIRAALAYTPLAPALLLVMPEPIALPDLATMAEA